LDGVRQRVEQTHQAPPQDVRAIRPYPILDDGRLLPLQPGVQRREVQHTEEDEQRENQLDCQVDHVTPTSVTDASDISGAPCKPLRSYVNPANGRTFLANPPKISCGLRHFNPRFSRPAISRSTLQSSRASGGGGNARPMR